MSASTRPQAPPRTPLRHGTAPALALVLSFTAVDATAHDFCVSTAAQLQNALDAVSDGGAYVDEQSLIEIVQGTYLTGSATSNGPFFSNASTSTAQLTIYGGYSAGCSGDRHPASSTILDGHGATGVMVLRRPNGKIAVTHLTFQNGDGDLGAGLQINHLATVNAPVDIDSVIIRDNHASADAGGLYASGASAPPYNSIYLENVLIVDNSTDADYGGAYLTGFGSSVHVGHSTISHNSSPPGTTGGLYCGGNSSCNVFDSIAWNNTNVGLYMDTDNALVCNDYGTASGTPPGYAADNLSVQPLFVDAAGGDYHLTAASPLLGRCSGEPFRYDLDDRAYPASGVTDMGAYEETIFADGLDG
jgi:hypothetical protein